MPGASGGISYLPLLRAKVTENSLLQNNPVADENSDNQTGGTDRYRP